MLSTGDVEVLYRTRGPYLQRLVALDRRVPNEVVEDACQHAWSSVLAHRARVDGHGAFAWVARTATREAQRLTARAQEAAAVDDAPATGSPAEIVELRDRLGLLRRLPARQQRLLWLSGAGLSYVEMARHEGVTLRTVERQLLRGKRAARALNDG
jgi:RNA polymerase sigma factor (sigma-70 family)